MIWTSELTFAGLDPPATLAEGAVVFCCPVPNASQVVPEPKQASLLQEDRVDITSFLDGTMARASRDTEFDEPGSVKRFISGRFRESAFSGASCLGGLIDGHHRDSNCIRASLSEFITVVTETRQPEQCIRKS